jgi:hypothetical protein
MFQLLLANRFVICSALLMGASLNSQAWGQSESVRAPRSNTQRNAAVFNTIRSKAKVLLDTADFDGDGVEEWLVAQGRRLFVAQTDLQSFGRYFAFLGGRATMLFAGHFRGLASAETCLIVKPTGAKALNGRRLVCYAIKRGKTNRKKTTIRRVINQKSMFPTDGQVLVGDFLGRGRDQILAYSLTSREIALYEFGKGGIALVASRKQLGLLAKRSLSAVRLEVGRIATTAKGTALDGVLIHSTKTNIVEGYVSANRTGSFRRLFKMAVGKPGQKLDVSMANVMGRRLDDISVHNLKTRSVGLYSINPKKPGLVKREKGTELQALKPRLKGRLWWSVLTGSTIRSDHKSNRRRHDPMVITGRGKARQVITHVATWNKAKKKRTYSWYFTQKAIMPDIDQDGDGIETGWELGGYTPLNNGQVFEKLNELGASPFTKDIFVEVDYMPGYKMKAGAIALATRSMAMHGINLHISQERSQGNDHPKIPLKHRDADGRMMTKGLGHAGSPWPEDSDQAWIAYFDPLKDRFFTPSRWSVFHYCLFVNQYWDGNGSDSTGFSRGIPGSDFIVAQPDWVKTDLSESGQIRMQAGTFLHELGHNLGLNHAGVHANHKDAEQLSVGGKPNHISVMNYNLQFGFQRNGKVAFGYSNLKCNSISEAQVNEATGISCVGHGSQDKIKVTVFSNSCSADGGEGLSIPVGQAVNFNGKRGRKEKLKAFDLNCDGHVTGLAGTRNEYLDLRFKGGLIGTKPGKRFKDALRKAIGAITGSIAKARNLGKKSWKTSKKKKKVTVGAGLAKLKSIRRIVGRRSWSVKGPRSRRMNEMNRERFKRLAKTIGKSSKIDLKAVNAYKPKKQNKLEPGRATYWNSESKLNRSVARKIDPILFRRLFDALGKGTKRKSRRAPSKKKKWKWGKP